MSIKSNSSGTLAGFCACLVFSSAVLAAPQTIEDDLRRQRQQQQQEHIERELRRAEHQRESSAEPAPGEAAPVEVPADAASMFVSSIRVDAGEGMPRVDVADILATHAGRAMDNSALFGLVRELTNRYIARGYSTTTMSLLPKSLEQGEVVVVVNWGLVEGWRINGAPAATRRDRLMLRTLMPGVIGRPLNIHMVDQAIENLNNASKSAAVEITPSDRQGYSWLDITTKKAKTRYTTGVNNASTDSTANGRYQVTASSSWGDVLAGNDRLSFNVGSRYYNVIHGDDQYNGGFSYAVPSGKSELSLRYSYSSYHKEIVGFFGAYGSNGDQNDWTVRYARNLWRDRTNKLTLFTELGLKDSANYIEDTFLEVNSQPYRTFTVGLQHVGSLLGGSLFTDASYGRGISVFNGVYGAVNDKGQAEHFQRLQANLAWTRGFKLSEKAFEYSLRLGAQYGFNNMLSSYKSAIGDEYTVRGYKGSPSFGDSGITLSNTITHSIPFNEGFGPGSLALYVGADWGQVSNRSVGDVDGARSTLAGAVAGLRLSRKASNLSLGIGRPIIRSSNGVVFPSEVLYLSLGTAL